ncbi:UDP-glucose:glycoprotein glucosyltransferase 1 [Liparis tanakae]|uniref:UDP-glucose:glycoprotein glucosyltransferase 1 n=1 Tax=Liparis tanakae TaxID=230148 RepID=A0A4Z2ET86_9TELE|nr:UDP-glucose:glycoprotein glucosyltransferase 1 [Liparis tanakae]
MQRRTAVSQYRGFINVENIVAAEYELEHLLLEGHCFDGYFQLKANPGAWILKMRKGRSDEIYKIYSHDGTDSPAESDDIVVVLNNFKSRIIKVKVQKKPDKFNEELLSDVSEEKDTGFWNSLARGFTGGAKPTEVKQEKDDVINIFSLASGHLYERFIR